MMRAARRSQRTTLRALVSMHDQFQLRLEHHHLLEATNAERGDSSELEVTRPFVREGLLMAESGRPPTPCRDTILQ